MAAAVNIVLDDAAGTPVSHTFVPTGRDAQGVMWWEDQSITEGIGFLRISMALKRPPPPRPGDNAGDRVYRGTITLHTPVLETLGTNDNGILPPAQVAYVPHEKHEFVMSERSSLLNRKTLRKMGANLADEAQFIALIENYILPT
jgi:hypothetical protein